MRTHASSQGAAFSLVEVTLALAIFGISMVSLLVLVPLGISSGSNAAEELVAMNAATAIIADLKATPKDAAKSAVYGLKAQVPAGQTEMQEVKYANDSWTLSDTPAGQRYRITVTTLTAQELLPSRVVLRISWPATNRVAGDVTVFAAFTRN
jgi:type II secretory pathway pseudopilin PulG